MTFIVTYKRKPWIGRDCI